jgi:hypothetical protein
LFNTFQKIKRRQEIFIYLGKENQIFSKRGLNICEEDGLLRWLRNPAVLSVLGYSVSSTFVTSINPI